MSALEPRIEAIRKEYGLDQTDFWQIPQNKQWVCKHAALEIVAVKAKIKFDLPVIIEKDAAALTTSIVVMGHMGERSEWATGETNPTNYSVRGKQPSYPWAMSEKRAKDRVILKLVGIHGLVYSEDEIAPAAEDRTAAKPDASQPVLATLQKDMRKNGNKEDLRRWFVDPDVKELRKQIPANLDEALKKEMAEFAATLPGSAVNGNSYANNYSAG